MPYKTRENRLEQNKRWRVNNKDKIKKAYQRDKEDIKVLKKINNKKNMLSYFEEKMRLKCERCGEDHISCLDFHHIDRTEKEYGVSYFARYSFKLAKKEMEKCIVLCSNCHRKEHWDDDKISQIKKELVLLEVQKEKIIKERKEKKYKACKKCGRDRNEAEFVKGKCYCRECYNFLQKEKMKKRRRKIKLVE